MFYFLKAACQFHAIVLGLDVLGNPYGFFKDLGEGVKDLFYEPYQVTSEFTPQSAANHFKSLLLIAKNNSAIFARCSSFKHLWLYKFRWFCIHF